MWGLQLEVFQFTPTFTAVWKLMRTYSFVSYFESYNNVVLIKRSQLAIGRGKFGGHIGFQIHAQIPVIKIVLLDTLSLCETLLAN